MRGEQLNGKKGYQVKIKWLGHAAFLLTIDENIFVFDPWIEGNPTSPLSSYEEIERADYVFISHDHRDHGLADGAKISKRTGAKLVGVFELVNRAREMGAADTLPGNLGGVIVDGEVEIFFARAYHSSAVGTPCGFLVSYKGFTLYHAGDTALYSDMKLLGERWNIDLALLPIGSTYTMDPFDASRAAAFLGAKKAIPMHYNTFPQVEADPRMFRDATARNGSGCEVMILEAGQSVTL